MKWWNLFKKRKKATKVAEVNETNNESKGVRQHPLETEKSIEVKEIFDTFVASSITKEGVGLLSLIKVDDFTGVALKATPSQLEEMFINMFIDNPEAMDVVIRAAMKIKMGLVKKNEDAIVLDPNLNKSTEAIKDFIKKNKGEGRIINNVDHLFPTGVDESKESLEELLNKSQKEAEKEAEHEETSNKIIELQKPIDVSNIDLDKIRNKRKK